MSLISSQIYIHFIQDLYYVSHNENNRSYFMTLTCNSIRLRVLTITIMPGFDYCSLLNCEQMEYDGIMIEGNVS